MPRGWIVAVLLGGGACFVDTGGTSAGASSTSGDSSLSGSSTSSSGDDTSPGSTFGSFTATFTTSFTTSTGEASTSTSASTSTATSDDTSTTGPLSCDNPSTQLDWTHCCADDYPGAELFFVTLAECVCGGMYECSIACEKSLCSRQPVDEECIDCYLSVDDECTTAAFSACFANPECDAFLGCAYD